MSLWQLAAMVDGYNRAHGAPAKAAAPSMDEHRARVERARAKLRAKAGVQGG